MVKGMYAEKSVFSKLLILMAIVIVCMILAMLPLALIMLLSPVKNSPISLRTMVIIQDLFIFILSAYIAQNLFFKEPICEAIDIKRTSLLTIILGMAAICTLTPLTDVIGIWNEKLQFPESLGWLNQWIESSENSAQQTINIMLGSTSWSGFIANLLIIGALAGLSEELFFRGIIQKILIKHIRNPHIAIFITAFIFSAIHFEFLEFVSRLLLGMLLGYLYFYGKSIWIPICAHTTNNVISLIITPCAMNKNWAWANTLYTIKVPTILIIISTIISVACIYAIYRLRLKKAIF